MKLCKKCKVEKSLNDFAANKRNKNGLSWHCKNCQASYGAAWYLKDRDKILAKNREKYSPEKRKMALLKKYGISIDEYKKMLKEQNNRCIICNTNKPGGQGNFPVDHDHLTGQLRNLLCNRCNMLIGQAQDNINVLENAIEYLKKWGK